MEKRILKLNIPILFLRPVSLLQERNILWISVEKMITKKIT